MNKPAILALADGTVFEGKSVGVDGYCIGELVFNTAMTGYQEILTDPSYAKQIITLTAAHIGNTGCNLEDLESARVWAAGLVIRECSSYASNYRSKQTLTDWLKKYGVIAIAEIDTRQLTIKIREQGAINACISTNMSQQEAIAHATNFPGLSGMDLAAVVSRQAIERWYEGCKNWGHTTPKHSKFHVIAYDFGIKHNILRILYDLGCHITIVPAKTRTAEVLTLNPDGVFLSNGPGDPSVCDYAIAATKEFLEHGIPILGICLGFQILALACGAKTKKMKFGHHGANHPVIASNDSRQVFITSQNHGFMLEDASLPSCLEVTHRSLFDNSIQGIRHCNKSAIGFQGHPEASPGPHDIKLIFEQFIHMLESRSCA